MLAGEDEVDAEEGEHQGGEADDGQARRPPPAAMSRQQRRDRLIFLLPSMAFLTVILFYPLLYSVGLSFYNYYLPVPRKTFVGLDNFRYIWRDDAFWEALGVTARFTGAAVGIELVLGIAVALLLDARIPCRRLCRARSPP